jgi:hypothetical protein
MWSVVLSDQVRAGGLDCGEDGGVDLYDGRDGGTGVLAFSSGIRPPHHRAHDEGNLRAVMTVENVVRVGGALHFIILIASALTPKVLNWNRELGLLSQFLRRLFWVYGVFIVVTIIGLGTISLGCAEEIAQGSKLARAFCGFAAVFWGLRLAIQFFVFDARPYLTTGF